MEINDRFSDLIWYFEAHTQQIRRRWRCLRIINHWCPLGDSKLRIGLRSVGLCPTMAEGHHFPEPLTTALRGSSKGHDRAIISIRPPNGHRLFSILTAYLQVKSFVFGFHQIFRVPLAISGLISHLLVISTIFWGLYEELTLVIICTNYIKDAYQIILNLGKWHKFDEFYLRLCWILNAKPEAHVSATQSQERIM
jgi:hypothetical protein